MIFGRLPPRFVFNHDQPGEVVVDLDYSVVTAMTPHTEWLEHVDELSLDRCFVYRRTAWTISVALNLYKYADPEQKYRDIAAFIGERVSFYRHREAVPMRASPVTNADMLFVLKELVPFFITNTDYKDGLRLVFESVTDAEVPGGMVLVPGESVVWTDPDGNIVTDPAGNPIMVWR
jgi:hypothetical protein